MTFTPEQIKELQKKLDPVCVKPPAPGKFGNYVEGWHVIAEANRIFGFDGWSYTIIRLEETHRELCDLVGKNGDAYQQWRVSYLCIVEINVGGVIRQDVGHGQGQGKPVALGDTIDSAIKEAVTDALKRALRTFGNPFGLALYDKSGANVGVDVDWEEERDELARMMTAVRDLGSVLEIWKSPRCQRFMHDAPKAMQHAVEKVKNDRKADLSRLQEAAE